MSLGKQLAELLFDPRGRASRQDLLVAAGAMLAVDLLLAAAVDGVPLYALKALAYWVGCVGVVKRLHDVGRSGWWLAGGAAALCMWAAVLGLGLGVIVGLEQLQPGNLAYIVMLALLLLPALGMTLWLHLAEGEKGMNRFGAEPAGIVGQFGGGAEEGAASRR
jgi:uncharacterized membrane protein YhaH (DUF805 family)